MTALDRQIIIHREHYSNLPQRFIDKIEADISYILKADIQDLKGVYLFGSCARGDIRNGSDIDLLILTGQKLADRMLAADIRWTLDEEIGGISTDVVFMNESSLSENTAFKRVVRRDQKIIVEVVS